MYDDRTNLTRQVARISRNSSRMRFSRRSFPEASGLAEAPSHGKPILSYDVRVQRRRKLYQTRERDPRE